MSTIWNLFSKEKEYKVIIVGLDNAGKTTALYKLLLNEVVVTAPTIGSNVEEVTYKNIKFMMWDIGGQESARPSWSTYYEQSDAVILVVDSTDRERMSIVKDELLKMLSNESLKDACICVFANKQDVKGAMTHAEVSEALGCTTIRDHDWHVQGTCALTGDGLYSAMDWLANKINEKKK